MVQLYYTSACVQFLVKETRKRRERDLFAGVVSCAESGVISRGRHGGVWSQVGDQALGKVKGQQPQSRKSRVEEGKGVEYEGSVGGVVKEQPHQELPEWLQHTKYTHYPTIANKCNG